MPTKPNDPFTSGAPLTSHDQVALEMFTSLMNVKGMSPLAPPAVSVPRPAQQESEAGGRDTANMVTADDDTTSPFTQQPKMWGRLTPDNWNSEEACRRDNVRCLFDLSPSTSPLREFAGKTPAIYKGFGHPRSEMLSVNECWKYYGYDPKSSEACSREVLRLRMERCVELRLLFPDDLSAIDMHELHCLRPDSTLHLRFWKEFPAEGHEMTIKLLCHDRKWTREQAEQHLAECEKTRATWKSEGKLDGLALDD